MQTLSKGYKKPGSGDTGFWDELEDNIERLNAHNHDGQDSELLDASSVAAISQTLDSNWEVDATHGFKLTVALPLSLTSTNHTFDNVQIEFRNAAGNKFFLDTERLTDTTYDVFSNDDSLELVAVYTT